jgi:Tfp pilus assembly protein PilX
VNRKGMVLVLTFIIMVTLTVITASFLYMTSVQTKGAGYVLASSRALWLAEAGIQKAVWYLKTPVASGGKGENWVTSATTEDLGAGSYTLEVERWDWALAEHSSTASASSTSGKQAAGFAIDGSDTTYWQSASRPSVATPQYITVTFPYELSINKTRFFVPKNYSTRTPMDYMWQVSSDDKTYKTVVTKTNNSATDVTDEFAVAADVQYLRLRVTRISANSGVRIATLEALGSKITSLGTASLMNRKIERTVAIHDGQAVVADKISTAYDQLDWNEIVPAL